MHEKIRVLKARFPDLPGHQSIRQQSNSDFKQTAWHKSAGVVT
jgi:hypothetical protein